MANRSVTYRRRRTDLYGHPKTRMLSANAYTIMDYATCQNILGLLRGSPRGVASNFAGMTTAAAAKAMQELCNRPGLARWWPELEMFWIVECLDEQSDGAKADISAAKLAITLPEKVRLAMWDRYGNRVTKTAIADTLPDTLSKKADDTLSDRVFPQEAGSRTQDSVTPEVPAGDPDQSKPSPLVVHVLSEMRLAVQSLNPSDRGPRDTPANRKLIAQATKANALDEVLWSTAIRRQLENVRPDRAKWPYLALSTICRPANMARLLDAPEPKSAKPQAAQSSLPSYDAILAEEPPRATR